MKKIFITLFIIFFINLSVEAFEECLITTDGKLTDISIEDNTIVNVYPLITIENSKNTLIAHPLKTGKTSVSVVKNNKEKIIFNIEFKDYGTEIAEVKGFEIMPLDLPPDIIEAELDLPPEYKNSVNKNNPLSLRGCE